MTVSDKVDRVERALFQLGTEIASDSSYDNATAVLAYSAIDTFVREASSASKALLFDLLMGE